MMIRADVKCYYCGFVTGQVEGDPASARPHWSLRLRPDIAQSPDSNPRHIRCARCGGPVFLDDIETVRRTRNATQPALATVAS